MTALKPCPFCGSTDLEVFANTIGCISCDAHGPAQDGPEFACNPHVRDSEWNTRAQSCGKAAAYVCTGCGRPCRDPDVDLASLREAGKLSCCPERDMQPVFFSADENEALRAARDWIANNMYEGDMDAVAIINSLSRALRPECEQIPFDKAEQAKRCSCHGSDEYCPCQNVADAQTRKDATRGQR